MKKRVFFSFLLVAVLLCMTGCNKPKEQNQSSGDPEKLPNGVTTAYADKAYGFQTELPQVGEEVAVLRTTMGDIYIRLFPEGAPKTVQNFTTHIKNGYYDGLTFHRVIEDFMIQGGDPKGDGTGGESAWGEDFADEFDKKLLNIRGSLAMANSTKNSNGSQFFINQVEADGSTAKEIKTQYEKLYETYKSQKDYFKSMYSASYPNWETLFEDVYQMTKVMPHWVPEEVWTLYSQLGGNIHLDGAWQNYRGHTVFGHVYQGMDVVDAIAAVEVDAETSKPKTDVKIIKAEMITYQG